MGGLHNVQNANENSQNLDEIMEEIRLDWDLTYIHVCLSHILSNDFCPHSFCCFFHKKKRKILEKCVFSSVNSINFAISWGKNHQFFYIYKRIKKNPGSREHNWWLIMSITLFFALFCVATTYLLLMWLPRFFVTQLTLNT
jgi:hypothetical protein